MSARAALVIGICIVFAGLVHGGIYSAGHDFVMNRFTGTYEFVPADDEWNDDELEQAPAHDAAVTRDVRLDFRGHPRLTDREPGGRRVARRAARR
jgi:hypothetical protein